MVLIVVFVVILVVVMRVVTSIGFGRFLVVDFVVAGFGGCYRDGWLVSGTIIFTIRPFDDGACISPAAIELSIPIITSTILNPPPLPNLQNITVRPLVSPPPLLHNHRRPSSKS